MNCPKCGQEQEDGRTDCSRCGIIFAKWQKIQERQAAGGGGAPAPKPVSAPRPAPSVPAAPSGGGTKTLLTAAKVAGLLVLAAGWYWFLFSAEPGLPVPANAYRDDVHFFAVTKPEGWSQRKMKECKASGSSFANAKDICIVLELSDTRWPDGERPLMNVTVAPIPSLIRTGMGGTVRIDRSTADEVAKIFDEEIERAMPGFERNAVEIISVDNLPAVKITGSAVMRGVPMTVGNKTVVIPFPPGQPPIPLSLGAVFVAGSATGYFIFYGGERSLFDRTVDAFDEIIGSFRVTEGHPTPFQKQGGLMGSVKGDVILGTLGALTIALFKLLTA